jgi:hypothetical protein
MLKDEIKKYQFLNFSKQKEIVIKKDDQFFFFKKEENEIIK